jgi:hypothetical protein
MAKSKHMPYGEIIKTLRERGFLLGGSRDMALRFPEAVKVGPLTDWDFNGQYTEKAVDILVQLGFFVGFFSKSACGYRDNQVEEIFRHEHHPIQVVLRKDIFLYQTVWKGLDAQTYVEKIWKSAPSRGGKKADKAFYQEVTDYFNAKFKEHEPKEIKGIF